MSSECRAGSLTIAGNDIDDAFRESCFLNQLRKLHRADGRLLSRFENDRMTCRPCRCESPRRNAEGEIPWNYLTADTDRLAQGVVEHLAGNGDRLTFDLRGPTCRGFKVFHPFRPCHVKRAVS